MRNLIKRVFDPQKTGFSLLVLLIIIVSISSCKYDVEEELYPDLGCDVDNMSYLDDIVPLLSQNCYQCHDAQNNFGNVTIDSHSEVVTYVDNGRLLGSIMHESGFSPMPQGASMLLECNIEKIESWINDGAPNN